MVGRLYFACISSTLHHPRSTVLVCGLEVFATEQSRKPYVQDVDARPAIVSVVGRTLPTCRVVLPGGSCRVAGLGSSAECGSLTTGTE